VITGAATGCCNVKALVYVAAFSPASGEKLGALAAQFGEAPLQAALMRDTVGLVWVDRTRFHDVLAGDIPIADACSLAAVQRPIAAAIVEQWIDQPAWKTIPSWYLVALADRAIKPELQRFMARRMGATTAEIQASHMPFLSRPAEVAGFIEEAASHCFAEEEAGCWVI
jgi:pimeloyl-ACP methyl ester carboxylesterase